MRVATHEDRDNWHHRELQRVGSELRFLRPSAQKLGRLCAYPDTEEECQELIQAGIEGLARLRSQKAVNAYKEYQKAYQKIKV